MATDPDVSVPPTDPATVFYVGQHETQRDTPVSLQLLGQAQDLGYDFTTTPLTTASFHHRVFTALQDHLSGQDADGPLTPPIIPSLSPQDSSLAPHASNSALMGVVSPWIDLASSDPVIATASRHVLNMEVAFAAFCGISNIIVHGPASPDGVTQYARAISEAIGLGPYLQIHILLPTHGDIETDGGDSAPLAELCRTSYSRDIHDEDEEGAEDNEDQCWEIWHTIRSFCNYSQKLSLALEIPRQLPSFALQSRWFAEPVRFSVYPHTSFIRNAKGYPVLSKPHQQMLSRFATLRFPPWILLGDVGPIETPPISAAASEPTPAEAATSSKEKPNDPVPHLRYLRHLQQPQPPRPPILRFGQGYQDYLQSPLQPLTDNLESITYEVFEKDPVKYEWYERAIAAALRDLHAQLGAARPIALAVVGAGRGPLITRALRASQHSGVPITCYAVEKNPNAVVLLQSRNASDPLWGGKVTVVKTDMRHWAGPLITNSPDAASTANAEPHHEHGKLDILVSELLGSFADNELSPECLDGAQYVLHPEHGISIPQRYSAHFTPIAAPRLHAELRSRPGEDREKWELPYVVLLHQHDFLSTTTTPAATASEAGGSGVEGAAGRMPNVAEAWSFMHPAPPAVLARSRLRAAGGVDSGGLVGGNGGNEHNARACCRERFVCERVGVCHGLAGYFEAVLYDGRGKGRGEGEEGCGDEGGGGVKEEEGRLVELSTNPVTMADKSRDMISWFPVWFPLKTPLYVPAGAELEVSMWRQTDDRGVWYEWVVEVFEQVNTARDRDGGGGEQGRGRRRRLLAMSEVHSSRGSACLM